MSQNQVSFPPNLTVPTQLFHEVAGYLASRPWNETQGLMQGVQQVFASHVIAPAAEAPAAAEPVAADATV